MRRRIAPATVPVIPERFEPRLMWAAHVAGSSVNYATIQSAVNAAPTGGTVTVDAGTYAETVTITKRLVVRGAQAGVDGRTAGRPTATAATESVVTGGTSGSVRTRAFHVLADDVTIDGFTVTGETDAADALGAGIVIGPNRSGADVVNDVIRGNVSGLFLANASATNPALVQHCFFGSNNNAGANGGRGIYTNNTISGGKLTNVTIDGNTFDYNRGSRGTTSFEAAIAFEAWVANTQSNVRITNNAFTNNGKATLFFNTSNVLIQGNTVSGTLDHWSGTIRFEGNNNTVRILYNTVTNNTGPGVAVDSKGMPGDNYGFVVNYNNFSNNNKNYATRIGVAANFDSYLGTFDARYNYWGTASGPSGYGPGSGDGVGGGYMDPSRGWQLTAAGAMTYAPFATATVVAPTGTVPAAPSALAATATGPASVNLAWTDNAPGNETGFVVQRSTDNGATYATLATTGTGVTTYTDTANLSPATAYAYRVYAVNAVGTSAPSNTSTATTWLPAAPTAPNNLKATATSASQIALSWSAATGQTAYAVDRSTDGGNSFVTVATTVSASATSYADAGLSPSTAYAYRVRATNGVGSATSNTASATTPAAGAATVSLATLTPTSVTTGWSTLQTNASIKGNPLKLRGTTYATGLGTHASSTITYALAGKYAAFTVDVGIDDETAGQGAVDFAVLGDGVVLYDSGVVTGNSPVGHVAVSVANVNTLTLRASPGVAGTIDYDHADWAAPQLTTTTATPTSQTPPVRTGTVIGTAGSYGSNGNTIAKAVDNNLSTYFDGPTANGSWVGLDLGSAKAVSQLAYAPRSGYASRMVGGLFQASTSADFSTGVTTLYTVTTAPASGVLTTVVLSSPATARYVRYLSPANGYGNVADVVFYG